MSELQDIIELAEHLKDERLHFLLKESHINSAEAELHNDVLELIIRLAKEIGERP